MQKVSFADEISRYPHLDGYYFAYHYGSSQAHNDPYSPPHKREQFESKDEWEGYCNGRRDTLREMQINNEDFAEMGYF